MSCLEAFSLDNGTEEFLLLKIIMEKLLKHLNKQLKTEYKDDAEDCLKIYNELKKLNNGHVWESQWNTLVDTIFKGFPNNERRYKPNNLGRIFLKGL